MSDQPKNSKVLIQQAAEKYSELSSLRAAVQLIPYIGGPLDTLIGGEGQKIQQRRIKHFISELDKRLKNVERPRSALADEELYDLMIGTFERVAKARSEEKRARFAQVIANEVVHSQDIDEVETAIRLVAELDDIHVRILDAAIQAPMCLVPFQGLRVVTVTAQLPMSNFTNIPSPVLKELFPDSSESMLRIVCSELVAKGLLRDEGIVRWNVTPMEYFVATDLAIWLHEWIANE